MAGEIKKYNGLHSGAQIDEAVDKVLNGAPRFESKTMSASAWENNTYSFEAAYPHEQYNISIEVAPTATADQFEAFGESMICGSANSNVATALGDVPSVDIPIIIKVVAK